MAQYITKIRTESGDLPIKAGDIVDGVVGTAKIKNSAVTKDKIKDGAVTSAKVDSTVATTAYVDSVKTTAEAALPKSGGILTGDLRIGADTNTLNHDLYIRRAINEVLKSCRFYWLNDVDFRIQAASGSSTFNYLDLKTDSTVFKQPVSISSGGTGATTADEALNKLGGLPISGGAMTGDIDMGSKKITNLAAPTNSADAANKSYVDGKRLSGTVALGTTWTNKAQTVSVSDILASDMPHWGIVYGTNKEAEKEAFALIDELETQDGKLIFRCFGDVPTVALTIQWEVNR